MYEEGGEVSVLMSTPSVITAISTYMFNETARIATLQADQGKSTEKAKALASVNVIVSDFGTVKLVPNRLQPSATELLTLKTGLVDRHQRQHLPARSRVRKPVLLGRLPNRYPRKNWSGGKAAD